MKYLYSVAVQLSKHEVHLIVSVVTGFTLIIRRRPEKSQKEYFSLFSKYVVCKYEYLFSINMQIIIAVPEKLSVELDLK